MGQTEPKRRFSADFPGLFVKASLLGTSHVPESAALQLKPQKPAEKPANGHSPAGVRLLRCVQCALQRSPMTDLVVVFQQEASVM